MLKPKRSWDLYHLSIGDSDFTSQVDLKLRGWSVLEKAGLAGFAGAGRGTENCLVT
jgi:hypothetical protein